MFYFNKLKLIIIICTFFIVSSCGENISKKETKTNENTKNITTSDCADFANKKGHKLQSAIVLDFVNVSKSAEFEGLSVQIADNIFRDVNRCFIVIDNSYVRNYIAEQGISKEKLRDKEIAKEIAIHFSADLVIYGTYNVTGSEIQIIGEISSVEKNGAYNDFRITGSKDKILSKLTELSAKVSNIASKYFPPLKIDEKLVEKEATSVVSIIKIVKIYQENKTISTKSKPKPDDQTLEQKPDPRPKWTWQVPLPDKHIYFVGQAMQQSNFNDGLDSAIKDAYLSMSRAVGKQIESVYSKKTYRGPKGSYEELTGKLIVKTLNYVRGEQLWKKYWRKLKDGTYEVCVLFKLSRSQLKANIDESLSAEVERLKEATALAEASKTKAEVDKLKAQMQLIKMLELQKKKLAKIEAEKPRIVYEAPPLPKVKSFRAEGRDKEIKLYWSSEKGYEVIIHFSTKNYPRNIKSGEEIVKRLSDSGSFIHKNLKNKKNYYYSAFLTDGKKYSSAKFSKGIPKEPPPKGMVFIKGGSFQMGCSIKRFHKLFKDEIPLHKVIVSDFWMDETEVTTEAFEAYIKKYKVKGRFLTYQQANERNKKFRRRGSSNDSCCNIGSNRKNHPVNCINWGDANEYCKKLGKRLPTEAEWEYAAGNGARHTKWALGNSFNKNDYCHDRCTCPVKSHRTNDFGLYGIGGNVGEWCLDKYDSKFYKKVFSKEISNINPVAKSNYNEYVIRGGGGMPIGNLYNIEYHITRRSNNRHFRLNGSTGFRCVLEDK